VWWASSAGGAPPLGRGVHLFACAHSPHRQDYDAFSDLWVNFWSRKRSGHVYPTLESYLSDVVQILREEVEELVCLGATYIQIDAPHYGCRATTRRFQPVPHKRFECGDQGASRPTMPSRPGRPGQLSWRPRVLLGGGGGISSGSRRSASADGRGCPGGSYSGSGDSGVQGSFARRCPSFAERPVRLGARREGPRLIMVEGKVSESFGPTLGA